MGIKSVKIYFIYLLILLLISCHNTNDYRFSKNNFRLDCNTILQKIDSLTKEQEKSKQNKKLKLSYIFVIPFLYDAILIRAIDDKREEDITQLQNLRIAKDCKIRAATPSIEIRPNKNIEAIDNYELEEDRRLNARNYKLQQRDYYYDDYRNREKNLSYYSTKRKFYRSPRYYQKDQYIEKSRNQKSIGLYNNKKYYDNGAKEPTKTPSNRNYSTNSYGNKKDSSRNKYGSYSKNGTDYIAKKYLDELKELDKEIFKR
ncbi:MAG: hypothetical protein ISP24_01075 [Rickettsiales bacterium]|nr:hypothetical protein [Rickettsiales bacterium]